MCEGSLPDEIIRDAPDRLADRVMTIGSGLVVLDGCPGAGKTWLADQIAARGGNTVIHADDYLNRNQGRFVAALRLEQLKAALTSALKRNGIAVLDGAVARDILDRVDLAPALFVAVQRNSAVGVPGALPIL